MKLIRINKIILAFEDTAEYDRIIALIYNQLREEGKFITIDYAGEYYIINKNEIKEVVTYTGQTGMVNSILEMVKELSDFTSANKGRPDREFFQDLSTLMTKERFVYLEELFKQLMRY